jgi:hypothetical protein
MVNLAVWRCDAAHPVRAGTRYECTGASTCGWKVLGRCEVWMTNVALEAGSCAAGACWTRVTLAEMICRRASHFQQPSREHPDIPINADDSCLTHMWVSAGSQCNSLRLSVSSHVLATRQTQQSHSAGHQRVEVKVRADLGHSVPGGQQQRSLRRHRQRHRSPDKLHEREAMFSHRHIKWQHIASRH